MPYCPLDFRLVHHTSTRMAVSKIQKQKKKKKKKGIFLPVVVIGASHWVFPTLISKHVVGLHFPSSPLKWGRALWLLCLIKCEWKWLHFPAGALEARVQFTVLSSDRCGVGGRVSGGSLRPSGSLSDTLRRAPCQPAMDVYCEWERGLCELSQWNLGVHLLPQHSLAYPDWYTSPKRPPSGFSISVNTNSVLWVAQARSFGLNLASSFFHCTSIAL